jgi:hypothetical protein
LLGVLPSSLHSQVKPVLEKWDKGVQQRFEQVQSQYSPYKSFAEQQVSPNDIEVALGIAQQINDDPAKFFETYQEYLRGQGVQVGQGQQQQQPSEPEFDLGEYSQPDLSQDPRFQQLEQQQAAIAQWATSQYEQQIQAQADAQLDNDLKALHEKHGDFDESYVLGLALGGVPLDAAVSKYNELVNNVRNAPTAGGQAPRVLTPGGGLPAERIDPAKLDSKGTRNLVAEILANAKKE